MLALVPGDAALDSTSGGGGERPAPVADGARAQGLVRAMRTHQLGRDQAPGGRGAVPSFQRGRWDARRLRRRPGAEAVAALARGEERSRGQRPLSVVLSVHAVLVSHHGRARGSLGQRAKPGHAESIWQSHAKSIWMGGPMSFERESLRHTVVTLSCRAAKAMRGAPASFAEFRPGPTTDANTGGRFRSAATRPPTP